MQKIILLLLVFFTVNAFAEALVIDVQIKDHKFIPDVVTAEQDKVLKLRITNLDDGVEEFESYDLNREKIVPAGGKIIVVVGPLKPGTYKFFGEFHQETAHGKLVVK